AVTAAADATTTTIDVTASATACAWTTSGATSWLAIAPPAGTGSGSVRLVLTANTATTPRSAAVTIAGTTVTVSQAAAAPTATPTCTYQVVPSARTLGAADVATSTRLETQAGCAWTATSAEPWLVVTTPSGTGSSTIALVVVPNLTASSRTGAVTIGGQTFSVTQEGVSAVVEEIRLDGIISQVSGTCPMVSFRVEGRSVRTTAATMFVANSCARLTNGADVEARGYAQTNGDILATRVRVKGGNDDE
ncbi:MAG: BACON domain-containing protein, partial [Acidobacteria bacterium]|nr:BACON domain-containing protein [Acidobacteriota bacterium]